MKLPPFGRRQPRPQGARPRPALAVALALALAAAGLVAGAAPAGAVLPAPFTGAVIDREQGTSAPPAHVRYNAVQLVATSDPSAVGFEVNGALDYLIYLAAPAGQSLATGVYEAVQRYGAAPAGVAGLSVYHVGSSPCTTVTGRFLVDEITRDAGGALLSFSARFEQHCDGADAALFGAVSYNATADFWDRVFSPDGFAFPSTPVGQTSTRPIFISNNGPSSLVVSSVQITGADTADFRVSGCLGSVLATGEFCTMTVTFQPATVGARAAKITVFDSFTSVGGQGTGRDVQLTGTATPPLDPYGEFTPLVPTRILDTRGELPHGLGAGQTVHVPITGRAGVPSTGVLAVVLNATVTEPTAASYLTLWPSGVTRPVISNLNFVAGQTVPNLVTVKVGANGALSMFNERGSTHVLFDVVGYYATSSGPLGSRFHPLTPVRYFDTRDGFGGVGTRPVGPGTTLHFTATGKGGVPLGATAVVMNVTVTRPTVGGYVTVAPGDVPLPNASNLNFVAGQTVANLAVVRVPSDGVLSFFNFAGDTHLLADVVGWYGVDRATEAGRLITGTPFRLFDTRLSSPYSGDGSIPGGKVMAYGPWDSEISALVMNVTATGPTAAGYITVFPCPPPVPYVSNLNFAPGQTVPNQVIVRPGQDGDVCFANSAGQTHLIADLFAYFTSSTVQLDQVRAIEATAFAPAPGAADDLRALRR